MLTASSCDKLLLCGKLLPSDRSGQLRLDVQQGALHHHQGVVVQQADTQEVLWEEVRHNRCC